MSESTTVEAGPAIILVEPQLGENVGTAARAMANFGLRDLRIVNPRDGWPNERAVAAASRAAVIDTVRVFASVEAAIADLGLVYATTARPREMAKTVRGPAEMAMRARAEIAAGVSVGVLFGRERIGLLNEEIAIADEILTFPVDPSFPSLNLAQAVLLVAYEWRRSGSDGTEALPFAPEAEPPASKEVLLHLFEHLESALDEVSFFRPAEKRPHVVNGLRTMLSRARLSDQEVRTLRGVLAALERRPTRPRRRADGSMTTERGDA